MRLSLAADDLFIIPPKWFFVKPYFLEAFELSELGALQTSQCQLVFSASIGSFQGLPAEVSEVILLPQRLALKYNTTPPPPCQHFLTDFFHFLCDFFWREENSSTGTILSVIAAHICTHLRIGGRCAIIYYITLYCAAEEGFVYDTHR